MSLTKSNLDLRGEERVWRECGECVERDALSLLAMQVHSSSLLSFGTIVIIRSITSFTMLKKSRISISFWAVLILVLVVDVSDAIHHPNHRLQKPAPAFGHRHHRSVEGALSTPRGGDSDQHNQEDDIFEIVDEKVVYSRWRTVIQRDVRMRNGKVVGFDLVGTSNAASAVLIFAWDTKTKTATMIKEYMPGCNRRLYGIAAGLVEEKHGGSAEVAAAHELEEEMHLRGGTWIPLTNESSCMDKYATTMISAFLVLDPVPEPNPRPLDDEEDIEIVKNIPIPAILEMVQNGEMNLVGGWACLLAIEKLRELGEYS